MLSRIFRRIADPPKCLELDRIDGNQEQLFFLRHASKPGQQGVAYPYVIQQRAYGRGLLSLASSVVCHIHIAQRYSLIPYVDLSRYFNEYQDKDYEETLGGSYSNPWQYYFKPVSSLSSQDVLNSEFCLESSLGFPSGYPRKMLVSQVQALRDIAEKHLKPVDEIQRDVNAAYQQLASDGPVLGVHFRGQEQKTTPYHPLSPTSWQIFAAIDRALDQHGFARIFLATEDLDSLETLRARYGGRIMSLPHFRTRSPVNAYRINPRSMHRYLLGREILTDTFILSRCHGLVSSTSNVTEIARAINNGRFSMDLVIDNGLNVHNPWIAKHLWGFKRLLPAGLGGFREEAITYYPKIN